MSNKMLTSKTVRLSGQINELTKQGIETPCQSLKTLRYCHLYSNHRTVCNIVETLCLGFANKQNVPKIM